MSSSPPPPRGTSLLHLGSAVGSESSSFTVLAVNKLSSSSSSSSDVGAAESERELNIARYMRYLPREYSRSV